VPTARTTLSLSSVRSEAKHLGDEGFRHLLLVSGEAPHVVTVEYLESVARALRPQFDSLSLEVGTFDQVAYERLVRAGFDGLTIYQETYLGDVYRRVHPAGPKRDAERRRGAMEQGGRAGFRTLGIGALLGLAPFRLEAFHLVQHAQQLTRDYWRSKVAISFPRMRNHPGGWMASHPVTDRELVQMICAARLCLPDAELVLSTREPARMRDHLAGIGITRMSAGSRTNPGGYGAPVSSERQFAIEDTRSPKDVATMLASRGFEPVWKDFDRELLGAGSLEESP
jgi:2-iminoacetate synthase